HLQRCERTPARHRRDLFDRRDRGEAQVGVAVRHLVFPLRDDARVARQGAEDRRRSGDAAGVPEIVRAVTAGNWSLVIGNWFLANDQLPMTNYRLRGFAVSVAVAPAASSSVACSRDTLLSA